MDVGLQVCDATAERNMSNSGRVYFGLRGDFVPAELTEALGIQPTCAAMAGERIPGRAPKCSLWDYSTEEFGESEGDVVDVYELSREIVGALAPHAERIAAEVRRRNLIAVLQVVLWISTDDEVSTPAIGFDSDVIAFLHRVGATIDIDIDTYRSAPEGPPTSADRPGDN